MFEINQNFCGLIFMEIDKSTQNPGIAPRHENGSEVVWHDDVRVSSVWKDELEGGDFVGYLDLDLCDRVGKPQYACTMTIRPVSARKLYSIPAHLMTMCFGN